MRVIIIGSGFAGLKLARSLVNKKDIEVLIIDRNNYHQFQPLFYQVATAGLDASNISFPLRKIFQKARNVHFRLTSLLEIKQAENKIVTDIGEFEYDVLVLATGATTNFFGNEKLEKNALPMKSTLEALQLRNHVIKNFEDALLVTDKQERAQYMTFVIVGGGPTGVELSGAIAEMRKYILPKDYPELDFSEMKIILVEGSPKTLAVMSEQSSKQSQKYLTALGVTVKTNTVVKDYNGTTAVLSNGETIKTKTLLWAAGVKGNVPAGIDASLIVKGNRIKVDRHNKVDDTENIYAIGDIAYMETPKYPHGHPQLANVAINQGKNLAGNLIHQVNGNKHLQQEFEYHDKGTMATVGRNLAVVDIPKPKLHFGGWIAWLIWMSLHLMLILGVKNKMQIFINWLYKYFTYDQNLRLLIRTTLREEDRMNSPRLPEDLAEKGRELLKKGVN
ncbi:NAD(P)/FAD-dependent oxidoreductase [Parafilimonas sp.]|uniref:NAD(P)/FAD-dependent oxidoreductase n=1 Tax=Parafilimonas sp. TaxID=1969739 RepID=UPI003F7E4B6D